MAYRLFKQNPRNRSQSSGFGRRRAFWSGLTGLIVVTGATMGLRAGDETNQGAPAGPSFPPEAVEFFESRVRPILVDRCVKCHGPRKQSSNLRLDSRESVLKGGESGPAVVPAKPEESLLIQAVSHGHDELKMPPGGKLPEPAIATLRQWVALGAPWPSDAAKVTAPVRGRAASAADHAAHWAFQPVRLSAPPRVQDRHWVRSPVDAFVLARLEAAGITPSPPAGKRTLIRRATIDLWGIPPAAEDVEAFEADAAPDSFAHLVDRLLASPRCGERWGRHWLDVARYADTKGYVFTQDRRYPYAYTYRDYVVAALNADLGYDQFILHQVAADQLTQRDDRRPLAALGFLTVGRRFLNDQNEIIDDRIDVVCRGLLGLTVTCARCHDHKYDPIPTEDYYSLYGVFASSVEPAELPLLNHQTQRGRLEQLKGAIQQINANDPASPARAMVLNDTPQPVEPHVFLRGNPGRPGPAIPRRFLRLLSGPARKPFQHGSGRLELARAIADAGNPLTARVLVNRVWQWHFGRGLVATPSDFGLRSDPPTHPELLDLLAGQFMASGWSIKALHRRIMLSSTYQQQSDPRSSTLERDPENRLLWRFNRQRLDFEAMRDSVLAVAGALRSTFGGPPTPITEPAFSTRRTLYGLIDRQNLDGDYRTFDFAVPDATSPRRFVTSVPQQALFLMNSHFLHEQARRLAGMFGRESPDGSHSTAAGPDSDPAESVRRLYRRVLGRPPEPDELALATEFIRRQTASSTALPSAGRLMLSVNGQPPLSPWEQLSQVLLLTNEFMFVD